MVRESKKAWRRKTASARYEAEHETSNVVERLCVSKLAKLPKPAFGIQQKCLNIWEDAVSEDLEGNRMETGFGDIAA